LCCRGRAEFEAADALVTRVSQRLYCFQEGRVALAGDSNAVTRAQISAAYFGD